MRTNRVQFSRNQKVTYTYLSKPVAIILLIIGILTSSVFFAQIFILPYNFFPIFLTVLSVMVGMPCFVLGIIGLMPKSYGNGVSSYNDHDLSRIRHSVEQQDRLGK